MVMGSGAGGVEDGALAGVAAGFRRLASWAQAGELAVVAQMVARSAAGDRRVGVDERGCPLGVPGEASAQVSLALVMSSVQASCWADLAVVLGWRLAGTGAALAAGVIDLGRARLIAEATAVLSDEKAHAVEEWVLPRAAGLTTAGLRAALRRAVIAADPEGAEERRTAAEARAEVVLYPDAEGTASLAGYRLPGPGAAAAMARISAMARALKAAGADSRISLLRAQVFLGLLSGTLPFIPPPPGAPPDNPPPEDGTDEDSPPDDSPPDDSPPDESPPDDRPPDDRPPDDGPPGNDAFGEGLAGDGSHWAQPSGGSAPRHGPPGGSSPGDGRPDRSTDGDPAHRGQGHGRHWPDDSTPPARPHRGASRSRQAARAAPPGKGSAPGHAAGRAAGPDPPGSSVGRADPGRAPLAGGPWDGWPVPRDQDAPEDCYPNGDPAADRLRHSLAGDDNDDLLHPVVVPRWPALPARLPGSPVPPGPGRPPTGTLDLTLPLATLAGLSQQPGQLSRLGPITATQARQLSAIAVRTPATTWRVIVTGHAGQAFAVARIPRGRRSRGDAAAPGTAASARSRIASGQAGVVGQVTITVPQATLTRLASEPPDGIAGRAVRAATRAARRAAQQSGADAAAGGCAHTAATAAYRPLPRLHEQVTARDVTCRFPTCRQPAWRGDLDHTQPYDQGGLTCGCNLGGLCRTHHILKQHRGWQLTQAQPGQFTWTTPAGRSYRVVPDPHLTW
jgi:hypothetical protein